MVALASNQLVLVLGALLQDGHVMLECLGHAARAREVMLRFGQLVPQFLGRSLVSFGYGFKLGLPSLERADHAVPGLAHGFKLGLPSLERTDHLVLGLARFTERLD